MAAIFQTTFSNTFSWMKMLEFRLRFPALVQIMAWRRPGDKPLSEPVLASLLTHICVTQPEWVNQHTAGQVSKFETVSRQLQHHNMLYIWRGLIYICLPHMTKKACRALKIATFIKYFVWNIKGTQDTSTLVPNKTVSGEILYTRTYDKVCWQDIWCHDKGSTRHSKLCC